MINSTFLILTTEKTGGLFDFDGTLILIAVQFLILTFVLQPILYNPLLTIFDDRKDYIRKTLMKAVYILEIATKHHLRYDNLRIRAKKQVDITGDTIDKFYQGIVEEKIKNLENYNSLVVVKLTKELEQKLEQKLIDEEPSITEASKQAARCILDNYLK